jgi:uncharacterized membrane protein
MIFDSSSVVELYTLSLVFIIDNFYHWLTNMKSFVYTSRVQDLFLCDNNEKPSIKFYFGAIISYRNARTNEYGMKVGQFLSSSSHVYEKS